MTVVKSKNEVEFNLEDVTQVKLLDSSIDVINPLWIIFWILAFFPMAIALVVEGFTSKKYTCVVTVLDSNEVHTFDKANYHLLSIRS